MTRSVSTPVAIIAANRVPFARAGGRYRDARTQDLLTVVLDGLIARCGLAGERLGEVAGGAVLKHSRDFNLTREAVLGSRLNPRTPASDVQQACLTSLQAAAVVADKIALGRIEAGIACGVDSVSDAPIAVNDDLRRALLALSHGKTVAGRAKALAGLRPQQIVPETPRNAEPRTGFSMGQHAALTAERYKITREAQDELAALSHQRLAAAYDRGFFDDLVTGYLGLSRDENLRPDTTIDQLAKLKPVFGDTMTAGNSSALTDGASAVLLGTDDWAARHNLPVLAHFVDIATTAVDFVSGDEGLLMAPVEAVTTLLARNNLTFNDFDFFEIHEAFASTVLAMLAAWQEQGLGEIDRDKVNVAGSSLATGHPFAATGTRVLGTAAKLARTKADEENRPARALVVICGAGGLGAAALIEAKASE